MHWFTADTHFSHANIMRYCNRPFQSVQQMNATLLENINKRVRENDVLFHLGDFCFSKYGDDEEIRDFRNRINCKTVVQITGNHDPHTSGGQAKRTFAGVFDGCYDMLRVKSEDIVCDGRRQEIVLNHYAMRVWNKSHHGAWHLYGHSHYSLPDDPNALSLDVGVDAVAGRATGLTHAQLTEQNAWYLLKPEDYRPINTFEVAGLMATKTFKPIDHHDGNR